MQKRALYEIAAEIRRCWPKVSYSAEPYLEALAGLQSVQSRYGYDTGEEIVIYFLANANGWRGEDARRLKAELRDLLAQA